MSETVSTAAREAEVKRHRKENFKATLRVFFGRGILSKVCFVILVAFILVAVIGPFLLSDPYSQSVLQKLSDPSQERRIRLIFRSAQTTAIPMVARLAAEESIYANVISASTQKLSEEVYGSMLLGIPNSQFDRAWQFFRTIPNLQAEEVSVDVQ